MKARTNDFAIRAALVRRLLEKGTPREAVRHEITLDSSSSDGRADMVVLRPDAIVGVEIKSGSDKLTRLVTQRPRYSARFDRIVLVIDEKHKKVITSEYAFDWQGWELMSCRTEEGRVVFSENVWHGAAALLQPVSHWSRRSGHLSPRAMLEMLHAAEVAEICRECRRQIDTRWRGIAWLAEEIPLGKLRLLIQGRLKARPPSRWEEKFWTAFDAPAVAA